MAVLSSAQASPARSTISRTHTIRSISSCSIRRTMKRWTAWWTARAPCWRRAACSSSSMLVGSRRRRRPAGSRGRASSSRAIRRCPSIHVYLSRLSRLLRPADQRPCGHHFSRRASLRSHHRRDPPERREVAAVHDGRTGRDHALGVQDAQQRRGRHLRWPAGRLRRTARRAGHRARSARRVGFRVRVPDGAHEPAAQAEDRDGVHDAGRAIHVHQLAADQGSLLARRPGRRPGAGSRRAAAAGKGAQEDAMTRLADRTTRIASSPTMKVTATVDRLRRSGVEVIDFGAGEPDFNTPDRVKGAGHSALDANFTRYTPVAGIADLKRAICDRYKSDYGVEYKESEVIVTAGGKQALFNAALALFDPGDEVITHAPSW